MIKLFGPSRIISTDEVLQVTRYTSTAAGDGLNNVIYVDGKPVYRNPVIFSIDCNVQPLDGRDLLLVPEMDRFKEQYFLFTNNLEMALLDNDQIYRNGVNYQVQNVETWDSFQQCRIVRLDVGPNQTP